ncbi:TorD/DmsD family molecular chaperone [Azospirillum picis]|uniref:TorA-specific chaperone n=1 Tax=Azospirillum picis TaxID=488438 RepID=A0ABU0MU07_9PROT|nr:molecular chaperone TorD family protein [Azospirillum picis]MBP2303188.1 TorA-specific chaperone [Azospirillum picis]MDQ0536940.1 TorA-specific chaperone [Azospirillum picis]
MAIVVASPPVSQTSPAAAGSADLPAACAAACAAARLADAVGISAALFGAPLEAGEVEALRRPVRQGALAAISAAGVPEAEIEAAIAALRGLGEGEAAVSALNSAFCLLFLGAGGPRAAVPYESAYRGNGRLFQEPAAEMAALLARWGLHPAPDFPEAPDHLTIELALLEETLRRAADGSDPAAAEAAAGLFARLRGWVPTFARACRANDPSGFYAAAAGLLDRLLHLDFAVSDGGASH